MACVSCVVPALLVVSQQRFSCLRSSNVTFTFSPGLGLFGLGFVWFGVCLVWVCLVLVVAACTAVLLQHILQHNYVEKCSEVVAGFCCCFLNKLAMLFVPLSDLYFTCTCLLLCCRLFEEAINNASISLRFREKRRSDRLQQCSRVAPVRKGPLLRPRRSRGPATDVFAAPRESPQSAKP